MRMLFYISTALVVMGLAFWAYRENYKTQEVIAEVQNLHQQIAVERTSLAVLNAEWAYLNRPDRLRALAEINFDRLGLLPLTPEQFGLVDQVTYPMPEPVPGTIEGLVEISTEGEANP
jgi:hypothetical protein